MKRWMLLILVLAFLLTAAGCSRETAAPKTPVCFYYLAVDTVYDGLTPMLHSEMREGAGFEDDIAGLLNRYLNGPTTEGLRSPFPQHVTVTKYSSTSNTATVELSSEFAQLSSIDLTLACACIANTLFDLTQVDRVQIFATDAQLDGQASVTLDRNNILFVDTPSPVSDASYTTAIP